MEIPVHPVQTSQQTRNAVVPQTVTMRAYEVYCYVFGPQEAVVVGDCRGGFSTGELIGFLYARSFPATEWRQRFEEALCGMKGV